MMMGLPNHKSPPANEKQQKKLKILKQKLDEFYVLTLTFLDCVKVGTLSNSGLTQRRKCSGGFFLVGQGNPASAKN